MKRAAIAAILAGGCTAAGFAAEQAASGGTGTPKRTPYSQAADPWRHARLSGLSNQREKLSEAIFELLEDVDLLKVDVAEGTVGLNAGRRVFANHDVLGSYTVVDHFRMSGSYPVYNENGIPGANLSVSFGVGSSSSLDFIHIHQALPKQYVKLTSLKARLAEMKTARERTAQAAASEAPAVPAKTPTVRIDPGEQTFDALSRARYGRLWNALVIPARTPLQADWIDRIRPGEILSYAGRGTLDVGPVISWNLDLSRITKTLSADLAFKIFVSGEFRVSVWREDERWAQVKVTEVARFGRSAAFNANSTELFGGVSLLGVSLNERHTSLMPFSFEARKERGKGYDIVFRYDLESPQGRAAYDRATHGLLSLSHEHAGGTRWRAQPEDAPVRRVGTRNTAFDRAIRSSSTRYAFVYRHNHNSERDDSDIVVETAGGPRRMYRATATNNQRWRFVWGVNERFRQSFRYNVDLDRFDRALPDAVTLTVEGEVTDTDTSGTEVHEYISEVETAANRPGFFPRPPRWLPDRRLPRFRDPDGFERRDDPAYRKPPELAVNYGRTSFYYQVTYSQEQIERFIGTPRDQMWPTLELAFGVPAGSWATRIRRLRWRAQHLLETVANVPLYAVNVELRKGSVLFAAEQIATSWKAAQRETDVRARAREVSRLFSSRLYGHELSRLLRLRLPEEKVSYVIQGSSYAFGNLREEGVATVAVDPLPERVQRIIDIDRSGARPNADPLADIGSLRMRQIDQDRFELRLDLPPGKPVQAIYIRLIERRPWKMPRNLGSAVFANVDDAFVPGTNRIILDRREGMLASLLDKTEPGNRYELDVACSRDGRVWGAVEDTRFEVRVASEQEAEEDPDPLRPRSE
ncbi:MAG: hypothetical protein H0W72_07155 [Planctomycetes bacterium]|nr:hypothetical protein [Planctomycetota bacterium]